MLHGAAPREAGGGRAGRGAHLEVQVKGVRGDGRILQEGVVDPNVVIHVVPHCQEEALSRQSLQAAPQGCAQLAPVPQNNAHLAPCPAASSAAPGWRAPGTGRSERDVAGVRGTTAAGPGLLDWLGTRALLHLPWGEPLLLRGRGRPHVASVPHPRSQPYLLADEEAHPRDNEGAQELVDLPVGHNSSAAASSPVPPPLVPQRERSLAAGGWHRVSWVRAEPARQRDTAATAGLGVPERAREARVHPGDGGIARDVGDLEAPDLVLGQPQHRVDVDAIGRGIDGPDVVTGSKGKRREEHGALSSSRCPWPPWGCGPAGRSGGTHKNQ